MTANLIKKSGRTVYSHELSAYTLPDATEQDKLRKIISPASQKSFFMASRFISAGIFSIAYLSAVRGITLFLSIT